MAITLARPVYDYEPVFVPPANVRPLSADRVPDTLQQHAAGMLQSIHGPGEHWWTMGRWYPSSSTLVTLTARRMMTGAMEYGTVTDGHDDDARALLVCPKCMDVRPDADVVGQGMSRGAGCVWPDCNGTYTDPR